MQGLYLFGPIPTFPLDRDQQSTPGQGRGIMGRTTFFPVGDFSQAFPQVFGAMIETILKNT